MAVWGLSLSALSALAADQLDEAYVDACDALSQAHRGGRGLISGALHVLASIAALRGQHKSAAGIIGGCDALYAELGRVRWRALQDLRDRTLERLRKAVSNDEISAWIAEGRTWSFDETVAAALGV